MRLFNLYWVLIFTGLNLIFSWNAHALNKLCASAQFESGRTTTACMLSDGVRREYRLHVPDGYGALDQPLPLLIALHGGGGSPKRFERYSRLSALSDQYKNMIVVYPAAIEKHWNDGREINNQNINDVNFLSALPNYLNRTAKLSIDTQKIFIAGMSNGGLMALRMACEPSAGIAGVAVVAASMSSKLAQTCKQDTAALSSIFIFGDHDTSFLDNGTQVNPVKQSEIRGSHIGIHDTIGYWVSRNNCKGNPVRDTLSKSNNARTVVTRMQYQNCDKPLIYYDVSNGGHRWPDPSARNGKFMTKALNLGLASHEISAGEEIWKAFTEIE